MEKYSCNCCEKYCFYNSIKFACGGLDPSPNFWVSPVGMKNSLKIGRFDQIEECHIPHIEKNAKMCINVVGDYTYNSSQKYPKKITLKYENGHYKFAGKKQKTNKIWKTDLILKYFVKLKDNLTEYYLTYDGNEIVADYTLKATDLGDSDTFVYKEFSRRELTTDQHETLLEINENDDDELYAETIAEYMIDSYDKYMKNIEDLKQYDIDISAHGYSIKNTALALFSKFVKCYDFEELDEEETEILLQVKNYGILYAKPAQFKGRCIDGNSWYPSCYIDPKLILPIGKPEYRKLDKLDEVISHGIYHVKISNDDPRLFLQNPKNWYTYIDIKEAKKRGYDVELICDGKTNHLFYNSDKRETGHYLFRGFVDMLYQLKKKNPIAKLLLNILWGALSQKKKIYHHNEVNFESIEQMNNTMNVGGCFVEKTKKYVLPHARFGVFITAFGRAKLADAIADIKDQVYRVHTDGYYTSSNKEFNFSNDLGGWKLEDEGEFVVENIRKPIKI
jgi:hypothetical protein